MTTPDNRHTTSSLRRRVVFWLRFGLVLTLLTAAIAIGPAIRTARERHAAGVLVSHGVKVRHGRLPMNELDDESGFRSKLASFRALVWLYEYHSKQPVIEAVELDGDAEHFSQDLARVTRLPYLDELTIRNLPPGHELSELSDCLRLRYLELNRSDLDKTSVERFSEISSLRYLCLTRRCSLSPGAMGSLAKLTQLKWLVVSCDAPELDPVRIKLPGCYVSR